tara:strand:- start:3360 stop:3521 length:162 start_codon:yes stop_codon:yes gene_type:complete
MATTESKVFIGTWVSKEAKIKLKMACAKHDIFQGDVIEQLILNWIEKPHIKND